MFKAKRTNKRISASMFYKYDACPHWLYFDAHGDPKKMKKQSAFAEMLLDRGVQHEKDVIADMVCIDVLGGTIEERCAKTLELMHEGVECIYHGVLMNDMFVGEPDILEKRTDRSSQLGSYYYVAVDIKNSERITDSHKYQLVCYGELLYSAQGIRPDEGIILNASRNRMSFVLSDFETEFHGAVKEIQSLLDGNIPPAHLSSSCKQSPWFNECKALAESLDDVALLYNVKKRSVLALRGVGIHTLADVRTMNKEKITQQDSSLKIGFLERIQLQATALYEKKHIVRAPIGIPEAPVEIFFDIEGDPLRQVEYLFGFLIRENGEERYEYVLADHPDKEKIMWLDFLEWLKKLPEEYVVYHYGTYELVRLTMLESKYGGSAELQKFREALVDLNEVVKELMIFPLYFYGIKDIGEYIGFSRSKEISGGGESVAFYEDWLTEGDPKKMSAILQYNEDDVVATRFLKDWLINEGKR